MGRREPAAGAGAAKKNKNPTKNVLNRKGLLWVLGNGFGSGLGSRAHGRVEGRASGNSTPGHPTHPPASTNKRPRHKTVKNHLGQKSQKAGQDAHAQKRRVSLENSKHVQCSSTKHQHPLDTPKPQGISLKLEPKYDFKKFWSLWEDPRSTFRVAGSP